MSDLHEVSSVEYRPAGKALANWTNTNAVLQRILQNLDAGDRSRIILRCDDLPLLGGEEADLENLFSDLVQMILQKIEEVPTLFLHISCTAKDPITLAKTGSRYFIIQFNTNIIPSTQWFEKNKNRLNDLGSLVARYAGTLQIHQRTSSGCIFSVSLPGKAV